VSIASAIAIYFIIWWATLFVVLPWGTTSGHETGVEMPPGHAPSAPLRPMMVRKLVANTLLSAVIFAAFLWLRGIGYLNFGV
jgi:predicted secreted protein